MKTRLDRIAKRKETHLLVWPECMYNCSKTDLQQANQNATGVGQYWELIVWNIIYANYTALVLPKQIVSYNIFN